MTDSGYEGMIGIADAADVQAGNIMGSQADPVRLFLDRAHPAFIVGIPKGALTGPGTAPVRLVPRSGPPCSTTTTFRTRGPCCSLADARGRRYP